MKEKSGEIMDPSIWFYCKFCRSVFHTKIELLKHRRKVHPDMTRRRREEEEREEKRESEDSDDDIIWDQQWTFSNNEKDVPEKMTGDKEEEEFPLDMVMDYSMKGRPSCEERIPIVSLVTERSKMTEDKQILDLSSPSSIIPSGYHQSTRELTQGVVRSISPPLPPPPVKEDDRKKQINWEGPTASILHELLLAPLHSKPKKRQFPCSYCGRMFGNQGNCRVHEKIHSGEGKMHQCPVCNRVFSRSNVCKRHMAKQHDLKVGVEFGLQSLSPVVLAVGRQNEEEKKNDSRSGGEVTNVVGNERIYDKQPERIKLITQNLPGNNFTHAPSPSSISSSPLPHPSHLIVTCLAWNGTGLKI